MPVLQPHIFAATRIVSFIGKALNAYIKNMKKNYTVTTIYSRVIGGVNLPEKYYL